MAIPVWRFGLCYYPAPKAANTSLKHVMHRINTGGPFVGEERSDGTRQHIHQAYGTPKFAKVDHSLYAGLLRFAVVRDPVERLLSVWGNRVIFHGELSRTATDPAAMRRLGLACDPDLATFVDRLDDYLSMNKSVGLHASPLTGFLGEDPGFFHLLFDIRRLDRLQSFLSLATGMEISLPRRQDGGPKATREDLTAAQIAKLEAHYARDYEIFGDALAAPGGGVRKSRPDWPPETGVAARRQAG